MIADNRAAIVVLWNGTWFVRNRRCKHKFNGRAQRRAVGNAHVLRGRDVNSRVVSGLQQ